MASKTVHLELVSDLSTNAYMAALTRFTSRTGTPSLIFSDNGTNFQGASNQLNKLYQLLKDKKHSKALDEYSTSKQITWKFIPPNSPHWGGLWEASVKSVKFHLNRITHNSHLTFEQFSTLLSQVEVVLNSRPLCGLSSDPNDFSYLCPMHFITGDYNQQLPEEDLINKNFNTLRIYGQITQMKQHFWSKWSKDYLSQLQNKPKWSDVKPNITIGALVLVRDDNLPPGQWSLGRVQETYPGPDGYVRVVLIKTQSGTYKRPITKLAPLPVSTTQGI